MNLVDENDYLRQLDWRITPKPLVIDTYRSLLLIATTGQENGLQTSRVYCVCDSCPFCISGKLRSQLVVMSLIRLTWPNLLYRLLLYICAHYQLVLTADETRLNQRIYSQLYTQQFALSAITEKKMYTRAG